MANTAAPSKSRLKSHGLSLGGTSQMEMIKAQSELLVQDYTASLTHSFHEKFVLGEKLGEG